MQKLCKIAPSPMHKNVDLERKRKYNVVKRWIMSRIARKDCRSSCFHIIVQGLDKENIFGSGRMKREYLADIEKFKDEHGVKVLGYCVMNNHCHLVLFCENIEELGNFMRRVNGRFAQFYNYTNNRTGYVFRDRFRSQAITNDEYMTNCLVYVHNNPVKAAIVSDCEDYAYSSMRCYTERHGLVDFDAAAKFFDVDAENVRAIMEEKSAACDIDCPEWADIKEETDRQEMIEKVLRRNGYNAAFFKKDTERFAKLVRELKECGMSQTEIAAALNVGRGRVQYALK